MPDKDKNSERSFFFDVPAAQSVFSICERFGIPIYLTTLDLTQQPGLLFTKEQVSTLQKINNVVAKQMASVTNVIPYLDARVCPPNTYYMHDLIGVGALLHPELYSCTKAAVTIGSVGELSINPNASNANVYLLSMPEQNQTQFYDTVLQHFKAFNCPPGTYPCDPTLEPTQTTTSKTTTTTTTTAPTTTPTLPPSNFPWFAIPTAVGICALGVGITSLIFACRRRRKRDKEVNDATPLIPRPTDPSTNRSLLVFVNEDGTYQDMRASTDFGAGATSGTESEREFHTARARSFDNTAEDFEEDP
jgi:hypothetical protein